jgi:hypothetical protein
MLPPSGQLVQRLHRTVQRQLPFTVAAWARLHGKLSVAFGLTAGFGMDATVCVIGERETQARKLALGLDVFKLTTLLGQRPFAVHAQAPLILVQNLSKVALDGLKNGAVKVVCRGIGMLLVELGQFSGFRVSVLEGNHLSPLLT